MIRSFAIAALLAHAPPGIHEGERQHGPEHVRHRALLCVSSPTKTHEPDRRSPPFTRRFRRSGPTTEFCSRSFGEACLARAEHMPAALVDPSGRWAGASDD